MTGIVESDGETDVVMDANAGVALVACARTPAGILRRATRIIEMDIICSANAARAATKKSFRDPEPSSQNACGCIVDVHVSNSAFRGRSCILRQTDYILAFYYNFVLIFYTEWCT